MRNSLELQAGGQLRQGTLSKDHKISPDRTVERLLAPLEYTAERSRHFLSKSFGPFRSADRCYSLPRYVYLGPKGGGDTIRIGIFATIHGDEPEGAFALTHFVTALERNPELGQGYALFLYPVCNPTGFEDNTRQSRGGKDLNREFWSNSEEPEVKYLQTELWTHAFHGLISLHSHHASEGIYGFVNGFLLSEYLLEPALRQANRFVPRDTRLRIAGFPAKNGIVHYTCPGVLQSVPGLNPPPFELTLATPKKAPLHYQVESLSAALQTILLEYSYLTSLSQNI